MKAKIETIMPGEVIATEEEFIAGKNTYSDNGQIKAKIMGIAKLNPENKAASVQGKAVAPIREGDIITGKIMLVKESQVVIELMSAENGKKITQPMAAIPVRNASTEYVENLKRIFKIGDIVRAKVVMASPLAIDLATNEKGLGVTKAFCSNCREEMQHSGNKLMCLSCGSVEERRWFEDDQVPRQQNRGFGGGPRFGGGRGSFGGRRGSFGPRNNRGFGGREKRGFSEGRGFSGERKSFGGKGNFRGENRGFGRR